MAQQVAGAQPPTQKDIVDSIVKEMISAGRPLYKADCRNELALRYWAKKIDALNKKIYEDKTFCDRMNKLMAIEYAGRFGRKMLESSDSNPSTTKLDAVTPESYRMMTKDQRTVVDVLRDAKAKNLPLGEYINTHGFLLKCWQLQDADFASFMKQNEEVAWEITALAKPESVTRFTRFIKEDVNAKYAMTFKPIISQ